MLWQLSLSPTNAKLVLVNIHAYILSCTMAKLVLKTVIVEGRVDVSTGKHNKM